MYKFAALVATVLLIVVALWFVFSPEVVPPETPSGVETEPAETVTPAAAPVGDLEAMECRLDVERWDTGRRSEVEGKYGENAEAVVEGCRAIVAP